MSNNGPNVHLVGGDQWGEAGMFASYGWNVVKYPEDADYLCFTGGADIEPSFYGESRHRSTSTNPRRDIYEKDIYDKFPEKKKLGICRGGQLLNVFSGGSMWQHVNNHHSTHLTLDVETGKFLRFSSVHHQMMIPGPEGTILAVAKGIATFREKPELRQEGVGDDIEAIWYPETLSFCFQPHPEWGPEECTEYFFQKISKLYGEF